MAVYEKKLKGTDRFLPFVLELLENLAKSKLIRKLLSYFMKFIKMEKITRFVEMDKLPI
ncbi:MAG: hypothetical protein ACTSR3_06705 [Candidatus Helarchaeota archaeon]